MEEKLRELIGKFLQEYMGTGSSGGNATDGNDITSPRPFADDEDEIENYTHKSIYGGDGGHYKNEPAFHNPNRQKMGMYELKNFITKTLKEFKGSPYGHATLATRDSGTMHSRFTKTGRPPGIMEDDPNGPIDPNYQGPPYDEVYLKTKLVGFKDAYEYDKNKGHIIIYPNLGSVKYKSRSTQEIVFKLEEGDLHFVRAFGLQRSYDELKKVLPELGKMGPSSYSGFMNVGVDDQPISLAKYGISGIEMAHDMIQALIIGRDGEAAAQSKHYGAIRTPGTGGTGIEERLNERTDDQLARDDIYHDRY